MKELSIEQKAKAYDEVSKEVKDYFEGRQKMYSDVTQTLEYLFPELKESEDERIRKALRERIIRYDPNNEILIKEDGISQKQYLAWLEKQGEEKPTEWHREDEQNLNVCLSYILDEYLRRWLTDVIHTKYDKPTDKVKPIFNVGDKIQYLKGCGTIMTIEKIENGEYIFGNNMGHTTIESGNKWHLVEQKSAWSEEDEEIHRKCICAMRASACGFPEEEKFVEQVDNWLKSLKDRVQPKQEWSEEDEKKSLEIKCLIGNYRTGNDEYELCSWIDKFKNRAQSQSQPKQEWSDYDECMLTNLIDDPNCSIDSEYVHWLKSLKDIYAWKPSEKQILAIETAINVIGKGTLNGGQLTELLEQLKAL